MNNIHLSNKEIYSMMVEPDTIDENLQLHLRKCKDCRKRLKRIKEFLKSYQEEIEHTEINWTKEKGKILSTVSDYRAPALRMRWGTAVVLSFIIVISAVLLQQIYFQPNSDRKIEETGLQKEIWLFPDSIGEVEFPQSIAVLTECEGEDFQQFLNFFLPIEEERNEKKDFNTNSLRINRLDQSIFA
ncbi:MAG: hypothetical protein J7K02_10515 [Deltaproteobacteria bacterium]|nr:hypothetical protein [Deltaproteobacteria bacterium]